MKLYPSDPDIETIVKRIEKGKLNLQPDFQRGEVWNTLKKKRLIDSILRGWHIPPIHVVDTKTGSLEVLDGQQRLATIRDFTLNKFKVDGYIDPYDEKIEKLNGLYYDDLPEEVRNNFDSFPLRIFTIMEYLPSEPSELFHRLNQLTNLTPAEQRNAYFGKAREQVKQLVNLLNSLENVDNKIGFSNSRMNYDEVIARFLVYIENNTLAVKVTSNELTNFYRSENGFSEPTIYYASSVIKLLLDILKEANQNFKFNKATLLSWLLFIFRALVNEYSFVKSTDELREVIVQFDNNRKLNSVLTVSGPEKTIENYTDLKPSTLDMDDLFAIFNDRSTSRVADVTSVQLRDYIIHLYVFSYFEEFNSKLLELESNIYDQIKFGKDYSLEELLIDAVNNSDWSKIL